MATLTNNEAADKNYEAWNTGNLDLFDEIYTPGVKTTCHRSPTWT